MSGLSRRNWWVTLNVMVKKSPQSKAKTSENPRVDYYPNRVGLIVATIAAVSLVILGVVAAYN